MQVRWLKKVRPDDNHWLMIETRTTEWAIRFGRPAHAMFSERNQGTNNIPIRWKYYLGGRISVRKNQRLRRHG